MASVSSVSDTSTIDNQREEELNNKIRQLETKVQALTKDFTAAEQKNEVRIIGPRRFGGVLGFFKFSQYLF